MAYNNQPYPAHSPLLYISRLGASESLVEDTGGFSSPSCLPPPTQRSQVGGSSQHTCGVCKNGRQIVPFPVRCLLGRQGTEGHSRQATWHPQPPTDAIEVCWPGKSWRCPTEKGVCQVHRPIGKGFGSVLRVGVGAC